MSPSVSSSNRVYLFDSTLRDGNQTVGIDFSVEQKHRIAHMVDQLGFAYLEAGWPGSNETDTALFAAPPVLASAKLTAFGMTRRKGVSVSEDEGLCTLLRSCARSLCLVGKTWKEQAEDALGVSAEENLAMIRESMRAAKDAGKEALFDAEHYFDGFKANPTFALACVDAALQGGADWIVLCDTNGKSFPDEVRAIVSQTKQAFPHAALGFHGHNDRDCVVANSMEAVLAGCTMVQGTLAGLGERAGNADLMTVAANLHERGIDVGLSAQQFKSFTKSIGEFARCAGIEVPANTPYVGKHAFAHKGGLHASAVRKSSHYYEHTSPETYGNARFLPVSKQAGVASVKCLLERLEIPYEGKEKELKALLKEVKRQADRGVSFDNAEASFGVLAMRELYGLEAPFSLSEYTATSTGSVHTGENRAEEALGSLLVKIGEAEHFHQSLGEGPVNALDLAMREALVEAFPSLGATKLTDFRVSLPDRTKNTASLTRVEVTTTDETGNSWTTTGVSEDIVHASLHALTDAYVYKLNRDFLLNHDDETHHHSCAAPVGREHWHVRPRDGELCAP